MYGSGFYILDLVNLDAMAPGIDHVNLDAMAPAKKRFNLPC
jgi:hypothetical protein